MFTLLHVFHVFMLGKYMIDKTLVIYYEPLQLDKSLSKEKKYLYRF